MSRCGTAPTASRDVDAVVIPGGFSYGDYLRCGAIARFAPIMGQVIAAAGRGMPVLGICNGFQILCESHLLPGALTRNASRHFVCREQTLEIVNADTAWTPGYAVGQRIVVPLKSGEGNYIADEATLDRTRGRGPGGRPVCRQPERFPPRHRRRVQRARQRRRPHAAPGARDRGADSVPRTDGLGFFTSVLNCAGGRLMDTVAAAGPPPTTSSRSPTLA